MQAQPAPRYGWYGDDFTGATDTLATLAERGLRALLFLEIPTEAQLAAAGPLDAIGIAGATRTMAPAETTIELDAAGRFFAAQGIELMHYKCCSTFDSAPHIGSIGAAVRALKPHFPNPLVPILAGQPNLGRYCLFGTLFAAAGIGGPIHRIDRHPTMGFHPVTPMGEADLLRHLAAQGLQRIALVDYRAYEDGGTEAALTVCLESAPDAVLFDVSHTSDLTAIAQLLLKRAIAAPMLIVGASSVAQMMSAPAQQPGSGISAAAKKASGPVLALVGSLSPVTRAQVEAASGFVLIAIDPGRLLTEDGYPATLTQRARSALRTGNAMLITDRPAGAPSNTGGVAAATAAVLRTILTETSVSRLVVAGGDTSTMAIKALDIWGLSYRAPLVAGAPLCRAHSADPRLDGLDIVLKGGQMGPPDFFAIAARG